MAAQRLGKNLDANAAKAVGGEKNWARAREEGENVVSHWRERHDKNCNVVIGKNGENIHEKNQPMRGLANNAVRSATTREKLSTALGQKYSVVTLKKLLSHPCRKPTFFELYILARYL